MALSEPFLVGYTSSCWNPAGVSTPGSIYDGGMHGCRYEFDNTTNNFNNPFFVSQVAILILSLIMWFYGVLRTVQHIDTKKFPNKESLWKRILTVLDVPVLCEFILLIVGIGSIWKSAGIAALRIIRPFRLLWYLPLFSSTAGDHEKALLIFNPLTACHICLLYIERVMTEIFTAKSRGGVVVIFSKCADVFLIRTKDATLT